jgi:hypothetical protein
MDTSLKDSGRHLMRCLPEIAAKNRGFIERKCDHPPRQICQVPIR